MSPILAIETSGSICSACLYYDDDKFYEYTINEKFSHSEKLFTAVDNVLNSASITLNEIYGIAVSSGPGSFTGLRIGLSAAKGLAFGSGKPIALIPTFDSLAFKIAGYLNEDEEFVVTSKVNNDEVYFAKFKVRGNSYIFVENLQILEIKDFQQKSSSSKVFGNIFEEDKLKNLASAAAVAKWCKAFGEDLFTKDYDYLEPNYLKNFIVKEKRK